MYSSYKIALGLGSKKILLVLAGCSRRLPLTSLFFLFFFFPSSPSYRHVRGITQHAATLSKYLYFTHTSKWYVHVIWISELVVHGLLEWIFEFEKGLDKLRRFVKWMKIWIRC